MVDHLTDMALASRVKLIAALIGKSKLGLDVVRERAQLVSTLCELIFVSLEISFDFVRRFLGFLKLFFVIYTLSYRLKLAQAQPEQAKNVESKFLWKIFILCVVYCSIFSPSHRSSSSLRENGRWVRRGWKFVYFSMLDNHLSSCENGKTFSFLFLCFGRRESEESTHVTVFRRRRSLTIFIDIFFLSFKVCNIGNDDVSESENVER